MVIQLWHIGILFTIVGFGIVFVKTISFGTVLYLISMRIEQILVEQEILLQGVTANCEKLSSKLENTNVDINEKINSIKKGVHRIYYQQQKLRKKSEKDMQNINEGIFKALIIFLGTSMSYCKNKYKQFRDYRCEI